MWAKSRRTTLLSAGLIIGASFFSYLSSLDGDFVFDDHRGILTNDDLDSSKTSLFDLFQHDFWGGSMSRVESHKSYRPLTVLTYRYFNFYFSELKPYSYHLVNVLLHCIASLLFLFLSELVIGGKGAAVSCLGLLISWPTLAALLFAVHSIHTEAVASIVGRAEVVSCIFFILTLLIYSKSISTGSGSSVTSLHRTKWPLLALSIVFSACALLSKEQGVMVIGVCASYDIFVHWDELWTTVVFCKFRGNVNTKQEKLKTDVEVISNGAGVDSSAVTQSVADGGQVNPASSTNKSATINGMTARLSNGSSKVKSATVPQSKSQKRDIKKECNAIDDSKTILKAVIIRIAVLAVVGYGLLKFRFSMNYDSEPIFKPEEMRAAFHPNRTVRMLSFSNLYCFNAWLLLSPSSLCCDWTLGSIPLVTSFTDVKNIWSLLLYVGLTVLMCHTLCSKRDRFQLGMGLSLLLLPYFPASGVLFRVGFVIAERVLYMPSLGYCIVVIIGIRRLHSLFSSNVWKKLIQFCLLSMLFIMAIKTYSRSKDWSSDFALFESGVKVNPMNIKIRNNYGMELKAIGRVEEARKQYMKSLEIDPDYYEVYFNLGNLVSDEGDYEAAAALYARYKTAVKSPQLYAKTLNNLATSYFRLKRLKEAEELYLESIQLTPDQATTYNNLASLYGETGRYQDSEEMFKKALKLNPTYAEAYFNLGTLYVQLGRLDDGERNLLHALKLNPNHRGAMNNLRVVEHQRKTQKKH